MKAVYREGAEPNIELYIADSERGTIERGLELCSGGGVGRGLGRVHVRCTDNIPSPDERHPFALIDYDLSNEVYVRLPATHQNGTARISPAALLLLKGKQIPVDVRGYHREEPPSFVSLQFVPDKPQRQSEFD